MRDGHESSTTAEIPSAFLLLEKDVRGAHLRASCVSVHHTATLLCSSALSTRRRTV
jgi:hypothetical protein